MDASLATVTPFLLCLNHSMLLLRPSQMTQPGLLPLFARLLLFVLCSSSISLKQRRFVHCSSSALIQPLQTLFLPSTTLNSALISSVLSCTASIYRRYHLPLRIPFLICTVVAVQPFPHTPFIFSYCFFSTVFTLSLDLLINKVFCSLYHIALLQLFFCLSVLYILSPHLLCQGVSECSSLIFLLL